MLTYNKKTPSPEKSNKSLRISSTRSSQKNKNECSNNSNLLKTPDKSSKFDKERNIKLDHSLSNFLIKLAKHPAMRKNEVGTMDNLFI